MRGQDFNFSIRQIVLLEVRDVLEDFQSSLILKQEGWESLLFPLFWSKVLTNFFDKGYAKSFLANINDGHAFVAVQRRHRNRSCGS